MRVIMAKHWGMCFGVRDALAMVDRVVQEGPVTILGELVHNPVVDEKLRAAGVGKARLEQEEVVGTRPVVITAHGSSDRMRASWAARGHRVIDATCPLVRSAHERLGALVARGYFPVVVGDRNHVEVRGLTGDWPLAEVVLASDDLVRIPPVPKIGVVSQTTQPWSKVRELVACLRQLRPGVDIEWSDTVCRPTKERQQALEDLCAQVDALVVVGGRHSNNTRQLVERARALGCVAHRVETADELQPDWFKGVGCVGLTAGTSTLDETVWAVRQRLEKFTPAEPFPSAFPSKQPHKSLSGQLP